MKKSGYKKSKKKVTPFSYIERKLPISALLVEGLPTRYLSILAFSLLLGLLYVANTHYYERKLRTIAKLEHEVEVLRVECTAIQSSYMLISKQSVLAQRLAHLGLYEPITPPAKVKLYK
jgi:hypothetical protein